MMTASTWILIWGSYIRLGGPNFFFVIEAGRYWSARARQTRRDTPSRLGSLTLGARVHSVRYIPASFLISLLGYIVRGMVVRGILEQGCGRAKEFKEVENGLVAQ